MELSTDLISEGLAPLLGEGAMFEMEFIQWTQKPQTTHFLLI
jgi:hypothetical protein